MAFQDNLPDGLVAYLDSVATAIESGQYDHLLMEKCIEECLGQEEALCLSREASRVVETVFGSNQTYAWGFLKRIAGLKKKKIVNLMCNRCGSHVIETLLYSVSPMLGSNSKIDCAELLTEWTSLIGEEWTSMSGDLFGSHVIRCLGRVLSGYQNSGEESVEKNKLKRKNGGSIIFEDLNKISPTAEMIHCFRQLAVLALDWNLMCDYINMESVGLLVQEFIELSAKNKEHFLTKFLEVAYEKATPDVVIKMWCDKQASRVWEKILIHCSEDEAERIYQTFLQGKLSQIAGHHIGNFPLQKLLLAAKSEEMVTDALDELESALEEQILDRNHFGLLIALVDSVSKTTEKAQHLLKVLMKAFHCRMPKSRRKWLLPCCLMLRKFEQLEVLDAAEVQFDVSNIPLQGSLLCQKLLELKPNDRILKRLLRIRPETILGLSCNVTGSHFLDKFFSSDSVELNIKEKFILSHFQGNWSKLARDKYGSRVLDTAWSWIPMKSKCVMAEELAKEIGTLKQSKFGEIVCKKYGLETYNKSVKEWRNLVASSGKKRKLLEDLIK